MGRQAGRQPGKQGGQEGMWQRRQGRHRSQSAAAHNLHPTPHACSSHCLILLSLMSKPSACARLARAPPAPSPMTKSCLPVGLVVEGSGLACRPRGQNTARHADCRTCSMPSTGGQAHNTAEHLFTAALCCLPVLCTAADVLLSSRSPCRRLCWLARRALHSQSNPPGRCPWHRH